MKKIFTILFGTSVVFALVLGSCAANKGLVKENQDLTSNLSSVRAKVSELEGKVEAQDRTIGDLEMQVRSKDEELLNLEGELARTEEQAEELDIQVVSREEEIAALEVRIADLTGALQTTGGDQAKQLNQQKQVLEKQVVSLRNDLNAANRKIDQLNTQIDSTAAELQSIRDERNELRGMNEELDGELTALRERDIQDRERLDMTYDELLASLKQEVDDKTVQVQRYKDALTINIMDKLFFDSGRATVKPQGFGVLDRIASIVKDLPDKVIRIEGHTDDVPIGQKIKSKYPSNWELGAARSSAVARYFIDKQGIEPDRIVAMSYSKYRPIVPNLTDDDRSKNRRIEIVLTDRTLYELMERKSGSPE